MKITKTSENYTIEETLENGWKVSGTLSKASGENPNDSLSLTVNDGSEHIGSYNVYYYDGKVNVNYSLEAKKNKDTFAAALTTLVSAIESEID